jgi:hypothetical protein
MTTDQIHVLNTADIQALTTGHLAALTTGHIVALSTDELNAFTTTQIGALSTDQFAALTTDQVSHISNTNVAAMTTAEAHALTTAQIISFTTDQITAMTTHDLASMTMTQVSAFTSDQVGAMSSAQVSAVISASPIVLDLNGDGISTTSAAQGTTFDLNATGHTGKAGWVSSTDGLLAIDLNHDGQINNGTELFGVATQLANGNRAGNGYAAMAQYDTNGDGKLDASDAQFKDLRVWVDANHDGKTDAGELKTLTELNITSLDLHGLAGTATNNGNLLGLTSSYTTADGTQHAMADVWFAKDTTATTATTAAAATPALHDLLAAPAADLLPGHPTDTATKTAANDGVTATHAHAAHAMQGLVDTRLLGDEDHARQQPLI